MKWKGLLLLACLSLGGCRVGIGGLWAEVAGPSRGDLVSAAFSETSNADEQRQAVEAMTHRYWGLGEKPLQGYALLAADDYVPSTVRSAALRALAQAGEDAADSIRHIAVALERGDDNVRWDAAVVLDRVVGEAAIEPLARARGDESTDVRIAAVKALRHYRKTIVVAILAVSLDDIDYAVRERAHKSLVEIVGSDMGRMPENWQAAMKSLPPSKPQSPPWWDIFHVTVKKMEKPQEFKPTATTQADTSETSATGAQK